MSLLRRIGTRLAIFLASLLAASLLVFSILQLLPGNVAAVILGPTASPEAVDELGQRLGLHRPFLVRYAEWVGGLLRGDLGRSYLDGQPVASLVAPNLAVTAWLVGLSMLLALLIAVPLGMFSAVHRRHWQGFVASSLSQLGMAVPAFLMGILLVVVFAVGLRWLPANGYTDLRDNPLEWARHLLLPVVALAIVQASVLTRYVRSATIEVLGEDWFRTARAVGWRRWPALLRHGVRNAALNVVTVLGLQLATMLVGAIVVETVFQLPGLGQLLLARVSSRDLVVVQAIVMLLVFAVLLINALVDILYVVIDPRLRGREVAE